MKKWRVSFWLAGQWMYDTIEADKNEDPRRVVETWWSTVHEEPTHTFTTENGRGFMVVPRGAILAAEISP